MSAMTVPLGGGNMHELTSDGRERHLFAERINGVWTCECGETRDRYGHPS